MITLVDAVDWKDASLFIQFIFLREGPVKIGEFVQIEGKASKHDM